MATIAIVGGSGKVGHAVCTTLLELGHTPRVLSRHDRRPNTPDTIEWVTVDYRTRRGLADALSGTTAAVFTVGSLKESPIVRAVIDAAAPDLHLVYLSIVGIDRLPMPYYRAKLAAENLVQDSGRPWTILRATQFHSFAWGMCTGLVKTPWVMFVPRIRLQPVAVPDVGHRLAELAVADPAGFAPELGGPEIFDLAELAQRYLAARGKKRRIRRFTVPGKLKAGLAAGANLTPDHADGVGTFAQYLTDRAG